VWPNPCNPDARVEFTLATPAASVGLWLVDLLGREVWAQSLGPLPAGRRELRLSFDGLASGLYLLRVQADDEARTVKLLVLR
jgi:hypothetical protein